MEAQPHSLELEFKSKAPKLPGKIFRQAEMCKQNLAQHKAAKVAQLQAVSTEVLGRVELLIGFLQISGTIFMLDVNVKWPKAWGLYYSYFLSLFSLQLTFAAALPFEFDFDLWNQWFKAPLVLVAVMLLYVASERFWLNGHAWKVAKD